MRETVRCQAHHMGICWPDWFLRKKGRYNVVTEYNNVECQTLRQILFGCLLGVTIACGPWSVDIAQAQPANRGWEGLARVLDRLTPSVDTEVPLSGEQINQAIETLLNQNRAQDALDQISDREAELANNPNPGADVQLLFLKGRALAQIGRLADAQALYQRMTVRYPELAQPWNNLAIILIAKGELDQAQFALETALMNDPKYADALANLADTRLLLALRDYQKAGALGARNARARANQLQTFINQLP